MMSTPSLSLNLFGGFDFRDGAGASVALPTRKAEAIFAYLAMNPGKEQPREKLAALIWEEKAETQARANLRKTISRLRQSLPDEAAGCLLTGPSRLALRPDSVVVDVARFEELAQAGTPDCLEQATAIYKATFLDGFLDCSDAFDDWAAIERRRLEELARSVLERLLEHYVITGAIDRGIQIALKLIALDPLAESVHRALIRLYLYQDRIGAAHQQYEACKDLLAQELGVEPAPETDTLHAQVLRQLPEGDGGGIERETDNLPERATVIIAAAKNRARRRIDSPQRPSIAVLSFKLPDEGSAEAHLGEGMAEDIITELGRFRELDVIAPMTTLAYGGATISAAHIGVELGVRYVLEGSLRSQGAKLRITARLIESASARQLWAEHYDCALGEVFEFQDDVVRRIVGTLIGQIEHARLEEMKRRRPEDWQAYDYWLRGRSAVRRVDLGAIHQAREFFQKSIERDPNFSRAYVGLAFTHLREWTCFSWNHWTFLQKEALELAHKAVALDDRDHQAHCMLAMAQLYGGEYDAANRRITKALKLNPNDTDVLAHAACAYPLIGDLESGVEAGRNALRLSPHHPEWYVSFVGLALLAARRYEEAIETMAAAPEAICDTPAYIAAAHAQLGQTAEVLAHRKTVYRHYNGQIARGTFSRGKSCIEWLLEMCPFRRTEDTDHYEEGLRKAGFE
jgi:DNA-binding SARP family transcriptional activator/Tfp pilus assembly protein PilF